VFKILKESYFLPGDLFSATLSYIRIK
jgi:hypothetical protein